MGGLRAYALAATEVRGLAGADPDDRERLRDLARQAAPAPCPQVPGLLGPIHRRVPGAPLVRDDDPTPADLETLLAGSPVAVGRATATWRLVETLVAGLAHGATRLVDVGLPPGLLVPTGLPVPAVAGLVVGWCRPGPAGALAPLRPWLDGSDRAGWEAAAARQGRPAPDVVVFAGTA